jgi:hypothetical protein
MDELGISDVEKRSLYAKYSSCIRNPAQDLVERVHIGIAASTGGTFINPALKWDVLKNRDCVPVDVQCDSDRISDPGI